MKSWKTPGTYNICTEILKTDINLAHWPLLSTIENDGILINWTNGLIVKLQNQGYLQDWDKCVINVKLRRKQAGFRRIKG